MKFAAAVAIGLVLRLLVCRFSVAPGVTVPVAVPVMAAALVASAAGLVWIIRTSRGFRSSPTWRWLPAQPVSAPSWAA